MIKSYLKKFATRKQAGDTIVEVLISVCVLSAVLASCYVIANHSLQTGTESAQRSEALSLAQKQIEYIKYAVNNPTSSPGLLNTYKNPTNPNSPFCIIGINPSSAIQSTPCQQGSGSQYKISTNYSGLVFTVMAVWDSVNSNGQDQMTLYYKLPGNFVSPAIDESSLYADSITNSGATLHGSINPNNNTVSYYFQYGIADFSKKTPTALLAQSDNDFHSVSAVIPAGSLTAGTTYQFRLCIDGSGCSGAAHFSTKGPPTITSLSATPSSIYLNGSVTITWAVMNANSCSASSSPASGWNGSKSTIAGSSTVVLTLPTTYTFSLTCVGTDGVSTTRRDSNSVNVRLPAPTVSISGSASSSGYYWGCAYNAGNGVSYALGYPCQYGGSLVCSNSTAISSKTLVDISNCRRVTITWSSSNATTCSASSAPTSSWSGSKSTAGTEVVKMSAAGTYIYTLSCSGSGGTGSGSTSPITVH